MGALRRWSGIFAAIMSLFIGCVPKNNSGPAVGGTGVSPYANAVQSNVCPTPVVLQGAGVPPSGEVWVDVTKVIHTFNSNPLGINLDYLRDDDSQRSSARPLVTALTEMHVGHLRFPGGEKSDWYLWSKSPYTSPQPEVLGWYKSQMNGSLLDFDHYMSIVNQLNANAYVVVAYDSQSRTSISQQQYIDNAVAWVRYANITKKYGIRYWEIGNEDWNNNTGSATEIAAVVKAFSSAMKAVDPTILIGVSGNNDSWWQQILTGASSALDFLVISNYPDVRGVSQFAATDDKVLSYAGSASSAIAKYTSGADQQRIKVVVTEFSAIDWSNTWPDADDIGHAMVAADTFFQIMQNPSVEFAMFWTTRWLTSNDNSAMNALKSNNNLSVQGKALSLIGSSTMRPQLVTVSGGLSNGVVYATYAQSGDSAAVFVINKGGTSQPTKLTVGGICKGTRQATVAVLAGKSGSDTNADIVTQPGTTVVDGVINVTIAPYSINLITIQ